MSRRIFTIVILSCVICLSLFLERDRAAVPAAHSKPELTANELASILGIHTWKLKVIVPANATEIHAVLQANAKGQAPRDIGGTLSAKISKVTAMELLVVIRPMDGDDVWNAKRLQLSLIGFGSGVTVPTKDNPMEMKGMLSEKDADVGEVPANGTTTLYGQFQKYVGIGATMDDADQGISLKITAK